MKQSLFILAAIVAVNVARAQAPVVVEIPSQSAGGTQAGGPIYIVNKYQGSQDTRQDSRQDTRADSRTDSRQGVVQEQPLTVVESSPLVDGRGEQMRRARLSVESQTESKIVERLESARIEDERARQERVLGSAFGDRRQEHYEERHEERHEQRIIQPVQIIPVQVVEPRRERVEIRSEINEDLYAEHSNARMYMSGQLGVADYSGKSNVQAGGSGGLSLGTELPDGLVAEGTFLYSTYTIQPFAQPLTGPNNPPMNAKLNQYNFLGEMKYEFSRSRFSPFVGALASYTYRKYSDQSACSYCGYSYDTSSHSFDIGLAVGADLKLTRRFAVGAEFRYLTNLVAISGPRSVLLPGNPLEKADYYTAAIVSKFEF